MALSQDDQMIAQPKIVGVPEMVVDLWKKLPRSAFSPVLRCPAVYPLEESNQVATDGFKTCGWL